MGDLPTKKEVTMICQYTRIIHSRGWKVKEACEYWGMRYDVWRRKCRNKKINKAQLLSMCRGLDNRLIVEGE